jgi:uncharacterized protein
MRNLLQLLRTRTGSPLSFDSLGRDLGVAANTARSYVSILEALHIVFLIRPYSKSIAKAQVKAAKLYFYDWAYIADSPVDGDSKGGAAFENLVASHLLRHVQYLNDSQGLQLELQFMRTANGKEIDFLIADEQGKLRYIVEAKFSDEKPGFALKQMAAQHPDAQAIQVVRNARHAFVSDGVSIEPAATWLATLT